MPALDFWMWGGPIRNLYFGKTNYFELLDFQYTWAKHMESLINLCLGMNLKILWDDLDDFGMALIKIVKFENRIV